MTLLDNFVDLLCRGSKARSKTPTGAEKRTADGVALRAEIDLLLAAAGDARANGHLWRAAESLELASHKLDTAGAVRRAIEVRRDAAQMFTRFAETTTQEKEVVAGYTRAARAFLVAGDIDAAKAYTDRAADAEPDEPELRRSA
jgi:hypothetical protein